MKVKDIMTGDVAQVAPSATIYEAAQLMQKHNIGSVPVCDNNTVIGIVTDRDIVVRNIANGNDPKNAMVQDVMTPNVATVTPETEVKDLGQIMASKQVRRIPVVDNNSLVGMVAMGDLAVNGLYDAEVAKSLAEISIPAKPSNMQQQQQQQQQ